MAVTEGKGRRPGIILLTLSVLSISSMALCPGDPPQNWACQRYTASRSPQPLYFSGKAFVHVRYLTTGRCRHHTGLDKATYAGLSGYTKGKLI